MDEQKREDHPVVLIDGACSLCQGITKFVIRHDPAGYFRFASLQSDTGKRLLEEYNVPLPNPAARKSGGAKQDSVCKADEPEYDTIVLIEKGRYYVRSDAALKIAGQLRFPWNLSRCLRVVPRFIRDAVYVWVARNRYRWFGKQETCLIPSPDISKRFLD